MTIKTFILHDDAAVHRMAEYLRAHRKAAAESGHPLRVTIAPFHPSASTPQKRAWWGFVLRPTSEQARVAGVQYTADTWAIFLKQQFLPEHCAKGVEKWRHLPDGSRELQMGFSDLSEQEADVFMLECRAYVQQELGVELPSRESASSQDDGA